MTTNDELNAEWAAAIAKAGVPTEQEMREAEVPTHETANEVIDYIIGLVDRPHDYGTCVYAMSMAATAAFNFVAGRLGVTGFQSSCADMDVIRRTRRLERFQIQDLSNLLYPQYESKFNGWHELLKENKKWLAEEAKKLLAESPKACPDVVAHWKWLASREEVEDE